MADVEISYNNSVIASLSDSGTEVLETNGTFLLDDITITYTKSGGGGGAMLVPLTLHPNGQQLISSKTAQELLDAYSAGQPIIFAYDDDQIYFSVVKIAKYNNGCQIWAVPPSGTSLAYSTLNTMSATPTFSYQSL